VGVEQSGRPAALESVSYRDLWEWINRPFDTPRECLPIQGELFDLDSILRSQT